MLIGHREAWREWRDALSSERMHHAWLLTGPEGIGKALFAKSAAHELVAGVPSLEGADAGSHHPDILMLERDPRDEKEAKKRDEGQAFERKRNIAVRQIRTLQQRLTTRPTMGERRAIIIDPADAMEKGSANALLKSLEEPPAGSFFLLISHQPQRLLPTIRSRCRVLRFAPIPAGQMAAFLEAARRNAETDERTAAISAAGGSPGRALAFLDDGLAPIQKALTALLQGASGEEGIGTLDRAIGARPSKDRLHATISMAQAAIGDQLTGIESTRLAKLQETYRELSRLETELNTFNYDAGLLIAYIGTLLAAAGGSKARAHV